MKYARGKLALPEAPERYVPERMRHSATTALAITHEHALAVADLPPHHRDPFDCILAAQARLDDLDIVTADPAFAPPTTLPCAGPGRADAAPARRPGGARLNHALFTAVHGPACSPVDQQGRARPSSIGMWCAGRGAMLPVAVMLGRAGAAAQAEAAFESATAALAGADGWRHYAYRMVAADAIADGWGDPARWLREALAYFETRGLTRLADACRALMRTAGVPVPRRVEAARGMPERLRAAGVTAREAEVLALLGEGLANHEIAERLFLSARTVERHLANVGSKLSTRTRSELVALAARATVG